MIYKQKTIKINQLPWHSSSHYAWSRFDSILWGHISSHITFFPSFFNNLCLVSHYTSMFKVLVSVSSFTVLNYLWKASDMFLE